MRSILILMLALAVALTGCAQQGGTIAQEPQPSPEQAAPDATPEAADPSPEAAPDEETLDVEWMYVMPSVMEAIMLTMGTESSIAYDPGDPDFFWTVLHTMAIKSGLQHPTVTADEGGVTVPAPALEKMAGIAFAEYAELPPIPEALEDLIAHDEAADAYRFTPADVGETYAQMELGELNGDGKMTVTMGLYRSATVRLGGMVFTLCDNPHDGASDDPLYARSVESVRNEIDLGLSRWQEIDPDEGAELQSGGDTVPVSIEYDEEDGTLELAFDAPSGQLTEEIEHLYDVSIHLADVALNDGYTELFVTGDMGSDDYVTYIYRVADGELQTATIDGSVDSLDSMGTLLVSTTIDLLGTYAANARCTVQEDFSVSPDISYVTVYSPDSWEYQAITLSRDGLPLVSLQDGGSALGQKGGRFLLMSTDLATHATLMAEDGSTYHVDIACDEDSDWEIAGQPESEWFEELAYAG